MNESGGVTTGTSAEVSLVEQKNLQTSHRRVTRDPCTIDSGANDDQVEVGFHDRAPNGVSCAPFKASHL